MSLPLLLSEDSITVRSVTSTKDRAGSAIKTYTDLYLNVPAQVEDSSTSPFDSFGQRGAQRLLNRVFTQQAGIAADYQVETSDGRKLTVLGVQKRRGKGTVPTYYVLTCEEMRPGV